MKKNNKHTFYIFFITVIGAMIGYFNTIWLFPKYLSADVIGYYRTIIALSTFIFPIAHFGLGSALIRFFPRFSSQSAISSFMNYLLSFSLFFFTLIAFFFYILSPWIYILFENKATIINESWVQIFIIALSMIFLEILNTFFRIKKKAWIGNFLNSIILRLLISILVLVYLLKYSDTLFFSWGLVCVYLFLFICYSIFLKKKTDYQFIFQFKKFNFVEYNAEFLKYGIFSCIVMIVQKMSLSIDSVLVTSEIGLKENSIYTTAFFMATIIEFPKRAVATVVAPSYVKLLKNKKIKFLNYLFKKISIEQSIIGFWILGILLLNIDVIYTLMPNGNIYQEGIVIVYIIALMKLIDLLFGHNTEILILSNKYIFLAYFNLALLLFLIIGNLWFIPLYGIEGVAWVTFFGLLFFNLLKSLYLKIKMGLSAFSQKTIVLIVNYIVAYFLIKNIISFSHPILNLLFNSLFFSFLFFLLIIQSKISELVSFNTLKRIKQMIFSNN